MGQLFLICHTTNASLIAGSPLPWEGVANTAVLSSLLKDRRTWNDEQCPWHGLGEAYRRACVGRDAGARAYRDVPAGVPTIGLPQAMLGKVSQSRDPLPLTGRGGFGAWGRSGGM
jgi:hypothetical protein